jgi:hypothetical protein
MIILYHTIPYYTILYINSTESEATRTQSKREGRTMDFSHSDIAIEPLQTMQDMSKLEKVCFFNPTFRYVLFVTNMVSVFSMTCCLANLGPFAGIRIQDLVN